MIALALLLVVNAGDSLSLAKAAIESGQYDAASDELARVISSPDATDGERFEANVLAGVTNALLGRDADARQNFRYVLLSRAEYELDPSMPERARTLFADVRADVQDELAMRPLHPMETARLSEGPGIAPAILVGAGAAVLAIGAITAIATEVQLGTPHPLEERDTLLSMGRLGLAGAAIGVVAAGAGGAWLVWGEP